jgi:PBP1b-binding outer membrane lipoprotein LpoB
MKQIVVVSRSLGAVLFALLILQGCNSLNPFCGSARPAPTITALSVTSVSLAQIQQTGAPLTVTGTHFVGASVVQINGVNVSTQVVSSTQLLITITTDVITATGTANVTVKTPGGDSADVGCSSGGVTTALVLTVEN